MKNACNRHRQTRPSIDVGVTRDTGVNTMACHTQGSRDR